MPDACGLDQYKHINYLRVCECNCTPAEQGMSEAIIIIRDDHCHALQLIKPLVKKQHDSLMTNLMCHVAEELRPWVAGLGLALA